MRLHACLSLLLGSLSLSQARATRNKSANSTNGTANTNGPAMGGMSKGDDELGAELAQIKCPAAGGVGLIAARGSTEDPGPGRLLEGIINNATQQMPGSTLASVDYPATLLSYTSSQRKGVTALTGMLRTYATMCPGAPVVLIGYSQGAQVVADAVSEAKAPVDNPQQPISVTNVAGILLIGDPSRVKGLRFNTGTSENHGIFPRDDSTALDAMGDRIVSICNDGDPVCDNGLKLSVHRNYDKTDGVAATKFIVEKATKAVKAVKAKKPKGKRAFAWFA